MIRQIGRSRHVQVGDRRKHLVDHQENLSEKTLDKKDILRLYQESRMDRKRLLTLLEHLPDPVFAFSLDNKVEYVNPAFEKTFGWTFEEIKGKNINFIPEHMLEQAKEGMRMLYRNRSVIDFETQRFTKDGRILDILINGSLLYDENDQPTGQALILRDMTHEKRLAKTNQVMFKISRALHQYHKLGDLIDVITKEIKILINVEGAFILLADETKDILYFLSAKYRDGSTEKQFKKIRFSSSNGVSGRAYTTGKPVIVPDISKCSFYLNRVDQETDLNAKNMLSVPMKLKDRTIGVVSVVNKLHMPFDSTDVDLLGMVASTIALPIENTRIHEQLRKSYRELERLNKTKDRVINHLAHELKTPVSILGASMKLLAKKLNKAGFGGDQVEHIFLRGQRNLKRILDIQYAVEDLLKKKEFKSHHILTRMIDVCRDELAVLIENQTENKDVLAAVQKIVDDIFGQEDLTFETIQLRQYIEKNLKEINPFFKHRKCQFNASLEPCDDIRIPPSILEIVITGLVRNAIEYTPDGSKVDVSLKMIHNKPELTIKDFGIGITKEKQKLIFDNFFTPPDSMDYSTKTPFDFNAGGRGFDLLRIKLFSERYGFSIEIDSERCPVIPKDVDLCPGNVDLCDHCNSPEDCHQSGGTTIHIVFNENI